MHIHFNGLTGHSEKPKGEQLFKKLAFSKQIQREKERYAMPQLHHEKLEMLIDLVRENDYIYNPSNRRHTDGYLIDSFWENVARSLDVEEMDANAWQKRWRNMRDSYVKHKKKSRRTGGRTMYKFARKLEFLDPYLPTTKLLRIYDEMDGGQALLSDQEDIKDETGTARVLRMYDEMEGGYAPLSDQEDIKDETGSQCESQNTQSPETSWSEEPGTSNLIHGIKRQSISSWNDDLVVPPKRRNTNHRPCDKDADMLLFESYALRLKTLPKEVQTVIKMQMSQIFFNAESTSEDVIEILPTRKHNNSVSHNFQANGESLLSEPKI